MSDVRESNDLVGSRSHRTRLRDLRLLKQVSQREVANAIGVPVSTYGAWERGKRELKAENIKRLATYFQVTPNEILGVGAVAETIPYYDSEFEELADVWQRTAKNSREGMLTVLRGSAKTRPPRPRHSS